MKVQLIQLLVLVVIVGIAFALGYSILSAAYAGDSVARVMVAGAVYISTLLGTLGVVTKALEFLIRRLLRRIGGVSP